MARKKKFGPPAAAQAKIPDEPERTSVGGPVEEEDMGVMDEAAMEAERQASMEEERAREARVQRLNRINNLSSRLSREAMTRVGQRQSIEERWLEDLQQYNGVYDAATMEKITSAETSAMFVNITRPKVKTAVARLSDMLFPTDDRNWAIKPTPVPELMKMMRSSEPLRDRNGQMLMGEPDQNGNREPLTQADRAALIMRKAKDKADGMAREIDDQLTEAKYPAKCRRAIHDACLYGTGVLKGPVLRGRTRRKWTSVNANGRTVRVLEHVVDERPGVEYVDVWNFFPDMAVATMDENASTFERMFFTTKQMSDLAQQPHYITENVVAALKLGARYSQRSRYPGSEMRDSATPDAMPSSDHDLFEVWEYHGPLEAEDLRALGVEVEDDTPPVLQACVVFVGDIVIKAYINPMETGAHPYKVFVYERDESCIFGYGVSYRMRHPQRMLNGAVRALMDNAALSSGPQIIIANRYVQPADGDNKLRPRKVWHMNDATKRVEDVMATFNIDSHQAELQAIINLAERFIDIETNLPLISQGEQSVGSTKTLGGISLLNNNANVITRDTVKGFDDGITAPMITDFYDWNMQNSENEEIKGDYEIDARGSTALLSKEIQAQNLMALGANFAAHPVFGPMTKPLELYRKIVNSMHISADDVVVSESEYMNYLNSKQDAPQDPMIVKEQLRQKFEEQQFQRNMAMQQQIEQQRHQNRLREYQLEHQDNLIRYATQERISVTKLKALLGSEQIKGQQRRLLESDKAALSLSKPEKPAKPKKQAAA